MIPSALCFPDEVALYRYRPGQDPDAGAVADVSTLIALDVPCSVQPREVASEEVGKRIRQTVSYEVLFPDNPGLGLKDLILYADDLDVVHSLFVTGQLDQAGRHVMWVVRAKEVR